MRHPFWILNSTLLFLFIITLAFIFFSYRAAPEREDIEPEPYAPVIKKTISKISPEKIYEHDPFGTTIRIQQPSAEIAPQEVALPAPPAPAPIEIPEPAKVEFLEPLGVNLKGIMAFALDETKNRAIIADTKTNVEKMYRVGDLIEDAQLLRIFNSKVLFIRSNGQQEILYLREKDALNDPVYASILGWQDVVTRLNEVFYTIDSHAFAARVNNLGQLLDMLDITTVYKKGESYGCRIGTLEENSLGVALGLQKNDIILMVNDIPATTTANRFKIYKSIIASQEGSIIQMQIIRGQREIVLHYKIQEAKPKEIKPESVKEKQKREQEQLKLLQKKETLAPTMQDIRLKERMLMREQGSRPITPLTKPIE